MGLIQLIKRKTFSHGVHPPDHKMDTNARPIRRLPFAPRMIIPLSQHIGTPAKPIVHPGQEVVRGEPIAAADGFMSAPVHAPATGVIEGIKLMPSAKGPMTEAILLKVYAGAGQEVLFGVPRDMDALSPRQIIRTVQDTGMVGLGGAAFPTHVKLSVPDEHQVDTLVVNGCECEPYLSADHRVMLERTDELIAGSLYAMKAVAAERVIIGVEDNKPDAVAAIRAALPAGVPITVEAVATKYPQGSEKMLVKSLLRREIPAGGRPSEIGVVVNNVGTLAQLGALLPQGQGLIERVVTIAGPGVERPGNYVIPLGTPLRFVLEQVGFTSSSDEVILGGPMMGTAVASLDLPITKGVSGILVFNHAASPGETSTTYPCIKCGKCVEACPLHLNPSQLSLLAAKRRYEAMAERFHLNDCFECGCCSYVCPSGIPLVQYFRIAKSICRERAA